METDARDIFDVRRERVAEMNMSVSCSVIGEGPGIGGRGADGGLESGAFEGERRGEIERRSGDDGLLESRGEGGMKDGGTGKASRRTGTAARLSRTRVCVVDVDAMVGYLTAIQSATFFADRGVGVHKCCTAVHDLEHRADRCWPTAPRPNLQRRNSATSGCVKREIEEPSLM